MHQHDVKESLSLANSCFMSLPEVETTRDNVSSIGCRQYQQPCRRLI